MKPILSPEAFKHIFTEFVGKSAHFYSSPLWGNAGDEMIHLATLQLFKYFQIKVVGLAENPDVVFVAGGGNMGDLYRSNMKERRKLAERVNAFSKYTPIVILPQSWNSYESFPASISYAREIESIIRFCPYARLAPDCALAFEAPKEFANFFITKKLGYFFRKDIEGTGIPKENFLDPVRRADMAGRSRLPKYFELAASCEEIYTNRLHFAIASMILERKVTLFPNSYHKNKGVYDLWLRGRGCEWREKL